jgi:hypothetical protein
MAKRLNRLATFIRWIGRPALASALVVAQSGCVEWVQSVATERPTIANYIAAVTTPSGAVSASLTSGAPRTGPGNPVVTAAIPSLVLVGGTIHVTASSATPFSKIAVVIADLEDYWELTLPAATTSAEILMVVSRDVPVAAFEVRMVGANGGAYGPLRKAPISNVSVTTGGVKGSGRSITTASY